MALSHQSLVELAARWLGRKCAVVITELGTIGETPDAIGWHHTRSTLVECKVSRADFLADGNKWFRREEWQGMGMFRYYLTTPGIIKLEDLPERWGLLEVTGKRIRIVRESEGFKEANHRREIGVLLSTLRRIGKDAPIGTSIKCYTMQTGNRATLGLSNNAL